MSADLQVSYSGDAQIFSLNRPAIGNSLSSSLIEAFHERLDEFEKSGGKALIIQGEGRHFCTGFDLADVATATDSDLLLRFVRIEELLARLWSARYMTIAIATGRAFGAGGDLFVACGRRIATYEATFSFPGAAFGLVLGTRRLCERVGDDAAQHLVVSGAVIDARIALRLGLATARVRSDALQYTLDKEMAALTRLDSPTFQALRQALGGGRAELDRDLAHLVRSAARPGLCQRVLAFRARVLEERRSKTQIKPGA